MLTMTQTRCAADSNSSSSSSMQRAHRLVVTDQDVSNVSSTVQELKRGVTGCPCWS